MELEDIICNAVKQESGILLSDQNLAMFGCSNTWFNDKECGFSILCDSMEKNKTNMAVDLHIFYSTAVIMSDAFDSM